MKFSKKLRSDWLVLTILVIAQHIAIAQSKQKITDSLQLKSVLRNDSIFKNKLSTRNTSYQENNFILDTSAIVTPKCIKFNYKQLTIPSILIVYGFVGLNSSQLKAINQDISNEVMNNIHKKTSIDDYLEYAPAVSVYVLNVIGVKGKSNFRDKSIVLASALFLVSTTVKTLKKTTKIERPDGSNNDSFPSGHTAMAFMGAEFLYQEYKDVSIWYGVSGYVIASATGVLRIYNNKHWLTDVATGAGIGILGTKVAYWVQPYITKYIFGDSTSKKSTAAILAPYYNGKQMGGSFVMSF